MVAICYCGIYIDTGTWCAHGRAYELLPACIVKLKGVARHHHFKGMDY
jgi:hypothetical protein